MNDDGAETIGNASAKYLRNVVPIRGAGHAGAAEFEHKPSLRFVKLRRRHVIAVPRAQRASVAVKRLSNADQPTVAIG
jgi:hypothetical protein